MITAVDYELKVGCLMDKICASPFHGERSFSEIGNAYTIGDQWKEIGTNW